MKRGLVIISILMMVTLLVACSPTERAVPKTEEPKVNEEKTAPVTEDPVVNDNTIKITSSGFSPKKVTVKAGTTVTFVNQDSNQHWPASAMHPTHTLYPGSSITKCDTSEQSKIFDACKGLAQGGAFSFTFTEKGSWKYHDHLSISSTGTVVVE